MEDYTGKGSIDLLEKHRNEEAAHLVLMRAADHIHSMPRDIDKPYDAGDLAAVDILDGLRDTSKDITAGDRALLTEAEREELAKLPSADDEDRAQAETLAVLGGAIADLKRATSPEFAAQLAATPTAPRTIPTVYMRDPIGVNGALEATEAIHFCSEDCREQWQNWHPDKNYTDATGYDGSAELLDGEVCNACGKPIEKEAGK